MKSFNEYEKSLKNVKIESVILNDLNLSKRKSWKRHSDYITSIVEYAIENFDENKIIYNLYNTNLNNINKDTILDISNNINTISESIVDYNYNGFDKLERNLYVSMVKINILIPIISYYIEDYDPKLVLNILNPDDSIMDFIYNKISKIDKNKYLNNNSLYRFIIYPIIVDRIFKIKFEHSSIAFILQCINELYKLYIKELFKFNMIAYDSHEVGIKLGSHDIDEYDGDVVLYILDQINDGKSFTHNEKIHFAERDFILKGHIDEDGIVLIVDLIPQD